MHQRWKSAATTRRNARRRVSDVEETGAVNEEDEWKKTHSRRLVRGGNAYAKRYESKARAWPLAAANAGHRNRPQRPCPCVAKVAWRALPRWARAARPGWLTAELERRLPGEQALVHTLTKACDHQLRECREWVQWKPLLLVGDHDRCKHVTRMIVKAACIEAAWFDAREGDSMFAPRLPRGGQTGAPSWPVMIMAALDTANPAIIIDHADEASAALVEQLSSMMVAEARHWLDTGLGCTVRLDAISWILATNKPEDVSPKLRAISHRIRLAAPSIA